MQPKDNFGFVLLLLTAVCIGVLFASAVHDDNKRDHFVSQCNQRGGIALRGYHMNGGSASGWLGCYKGLTEIYNED